MSTGSLSLKKIVLLLGDAALLAASLALALVIRSGGLPHPALLSLYRFAAPYLGLIWITGLVVFGLYDPRLMKNDPEFFERLGKAVAFDFAATAFLFYLIPGFGLRPVLTLGLIAVIAAAGLAAWRGLFNILLSRRRRERVLFFGINEEAIELARHLIANPQLGFSPAGFFGSAPGRATRMLGRPVFHSEHLSDIVQRLGIDRIIVAHHIERSDQLVRTLFEILPLGATIADFPRFYEETLGRVPVSLITESWFIENLIGSRRPRYEFAKRITDLTMAFAIGGAALLLLPAIALAIIVSTPADVLRHRLRRARPGDGVVFFRQPRVGRHGAVFNFIKFRSQVLGAERLGAEKEAGKDPRSYPVGTFLRKTYLDELPQLWNVIRGEMSFVGPRPERPEFVAAFEAALPFYRMRELVPPGITGWAQINMENDASVSDAPEKIQYDLSYIKNRSLLFDLSILARTAFKLMQRSGR